MQWTPPASPVHAQRSQLSLFTRALAERSGREFSSWGELHAWSTLEFREFWRLFVEWCGPRLGLAGEAEPACVGDLCETARFFPNLQLNYADSLLNGCAAAGDARALTEVHADGSRRTWTRAELRHEVTRLAASLQAMGLHPGDRVVAVMRNDARAVIAALAVTAVGATLSTVSPDLGVQAMLDRFVGLSPRLLVAHVAQRSFDSGAPLPDKIATLVRELASLRFVLRLDEAQLPDTGATGSVSLEALLARGDASRFEWRRFPFDHPLFIMFSSGTTGRPKCIVHGAGGTLLEHVKEHRLHTDLRAGDRMYFHTSCAWMMWNWQLSALASGVEIVTYDGPISSADRLWRLACEERVTVFGTSPGYLRMSQDAQLAPGRQFDLSALRAILSTGAVLHDQQFGWVREQVKAVPLQSISGGTDIIGCFVLGHPDLPVTTGEAQCKSLGLDVQAWKNGAPTDGIGELVCTNPFPSRPLGFLGDADGARFHAAYFAQNPGVWTHGDLIEFPPTGGARLHGRSDGVLNVRGIKFAPIEIYRALNAVPEIRDVMVVEQQPGRASDDGSPDQRIVALLVLQGGAVLDSRLATRIREQIATHLSPAHVPDALIAVPELPVTYSGKPSEAAARAAVNGQAVANADALRNPASLEAIRRQVALAEGTDREAPDAAQQTLTTQLRKLFQRHLGLADISLDDSFFELGGKSIAAVRLLADVQRQTGRALPIGALMHAPSVTQLTAVIEGRASVPSSSVLVPMRRGSGNPLFVLHSLSGTIVEMWPIVAAMRTSRPVWGLQVAGIDGEQAPHERVEDFAASYIEQMRTIQPKGPYALCGFSFGGAVAFEMARRLAQAGERLELVCLLDPYLYHALSWRTAPRQIWIRTAARLARVRAREIPEFVAHYLGRAADEVATRLGLKPRSRPRPPQYLELSPARGRVYDALRAAIETYRPEPYEAGPIAFVRASTLVGGYFDPMPVWRRVARRGLDVIDVPGVHLDVIGPNAELVALHIDTLLAWSSRTAQLTSAARAPDPIPA